MTLPGWTKRRIFTRILLVICGLLAGLLFAEVGLRVLEVFGPDQLDRDLAGRSQLIPDQKIGVRIRPYASGHDANGFRNDIAPVQSDIVAIGDSQTWGNNANRSQAWPQTLARLSGHTTYNMGFGAYNSVEYWVLTEEALRLSPKIIVIGLYFGNDIWGAYSTVYVTDRHPGFRDNEAGMALYSDTVVPQVEALANEKAESRIWLQRSLFTTWALKLKEYSATIRLLVKSVGTLTNSAYRQGEAWAQTNPDDAAVYNNGKVFTALEPAYRLLALDMDEQRIIEGLRITKEMLLLIKAETDIADVKLLILLIPTKETVYADAVEISQGHLSATYAKLVQMETRVRNEIVMLCKQSGIEYVDALPALRDAVQRNEKIYLSSADGHPIARGYFCIASAVYEKSSRLGWLEGD